MNFFHDSHKRKKKTYVRISVRVLAIFYLLFLITYQLQSPTTAYYSNSNKLNGTLAAMNDFGETEIMESSEAEEQEVEEEVKEEISEEVTKKVTEEANEEMNEEVKEEANEKIDEEINEEEITEDNDGSDKSDFEESNQN